MSGSLRRHGADASRRYVVAEASPAVRRVHDGLGVPLTIPAPAPARGGAR